MLVSTKQNNEEADNFSSTSVTYDLFVQSALPPVTKTHSNYQAKKKEVKSTQKQPSCEKKGAAHVKTTA